MRRKLARDTGQEVRLVLTLISCPECFVAAEVTDRFSLPGTGGPVDHVALRCAAGHHFRMPTDMLPAQEQEQLPGARAGAGPAARDLSFHVEVPVSLRRACRADAAIQLWHDSHGYLRRLPCTHS
jgi:hypothetical protein